MKTKEKWVRVYNERDLVEGDRIRYYDRYSDTGNIRNPIGFESSVGQENTERYFYGRSEHPYLFIIAEKKDKTVCFLYNPFESYEYVEKLVIETENLKPKRVPTELEQRMINLML